MCVCVCEYVLSARASHAFGLLRPYVLGQSECRCRLMSSKQWAMLALLSAPGLTAHNCPDNQDWIDYQLGQK